MNEKKIMKVRCEVFTRVCGFYRPVNQFNAAKKQEYIERLPFSMDNLFNDIWEQK